MVAPCGFGWHEVGRDVLSDGQTGATSRSADWVATAVIPTVTGEGRKPMKVNHRPSENSHRATGRVAIADQGELFS